jgi:hypothetical protein
VQGILQAVDRGQQISCRRELDGIELSLGHPSPPKSSQPTRQW